MFSASCFQLRVSLLTILQLLKGDPWRLRKGTLDFNLKLLFQIDFSKQRYATITGRERERERERERGAKVKWRRGLGFKSGKTGKPGIELMIVYKASSFTSTRRRFLIYKGSPPHTHLVYYLAGTRVWDDREPYRPNLYFYSTPCECVATLLKFPELK